MKLPSFGARLYMCSSLLLLAVGMCPPSGAQTATADSDYLREQMGEQLESVRESGRRAFQGLLLYPKEVRDAALKIVQRPELIVRLAEARGESAEAPPADTPEDFQQAFRKLREHREVVEILDANLITAALMGQVVAEKEEEIEQIVDRMAARAAETAENSATQWAGRLDADPAARDELQQAAADFARESSEPALSSPSEAQTQSTANLNINVYNYTPACAYPYYGYPYYYYYRYGYCVPAAGGLVVWGVPTYEVNYFVLVHADRYPNLADAIVTQWEEGENLDDFKAAVSDWRDERKEDWPEDFLRRDGDRAQRLGELAAFEKDLSGARERLGEDAVERAHYLRQRSADYPSLARFSGEGGSLPEVSRPSREAMLESAKTSRGTRGGDGRAGGPVRREQPTYQQQVGRAREFHRTTWSGEGRRGGTRRGGGRRGRR